MGKLLDCIKALTLLGFAFVWVENSECLYVLGRNRIQTWIEKQDLTNDGNYNDLPTSNKITEQPETESKSSIPMSPETTTSLITPLPTTSTEITSTKPSQTTITASLTTGNTPESVTTTSQPSKTTLAPLKTTTTDTTHPSLTTVFPEPNQPESNWSWGSFFAGIIVSTCVLAAAYVLWIVFLRGSQSGYIPL